MIHILFLKKKTNFNNKYIYNKYILYKNICK